MEKHSSSQQALEIANMLDPLAEVLDQRWRLAFDKDSCIVTNTRNMTAPIAEVLDQSSLELQRRQQYQVKSGQNKNRNFQRLDVLVGVLTFDNFYFQLEAAK